MTAPTDPGFSAPKPREFVSDALKTGELPQVSSDDTGGPPRPHRFHRIQLTLKLLAFIVVIYFAISVIVPGVRNAAARIIDVNPAYLAAGFALEMLALFSYSLLTQAALGASGSLLSPWRLFRIQLSTKSLSSIVPGGSAAGSALGYRLMTMSGVPGPDAGFALATAGLGSAVVLNLVFWGALAVSIPIRGVNPGYATAAVAGIVLMLLAGVLVFGLLEGQGRAERMLRWIARKLRLSEDRAAAGVRHIGGRLEELAADRQLLAGGATGRTFPQLAASPRATTAAATMRKVNALPMRRDDCGRTEQPRSKTRGDRRGRNYGILPNDGIGLAGCRRFSIP